MSLKKTLRFSIVLCLLLAAFWHMSRTYSAQTILYELGGTVDAIDVEKTYRDFPNATLNWEMRTPDYTLIMTTGNDHLHRQRTALKGDYANLYGQDLTLSRAVADKLFKTDIANYQTHKVFGRPYLLTQVIREGNVAYIPYDKSLLNERWERVRFYYTADTMASAELVDERLSNLMALSGLKIYNKTFQKNAIFLFYNLALGLCLYMAFQYFQQTKAKMDKQCQVIRETHNTYLPFYGIKTFVKAEKKLLLQFGLTIGLMIMEGFVALGLLKNLILPMQLIPSNWFSLSSYWDICKLFLNNALFQIQNGLVPVVQTQLFWVVILLVYLLVIDKLLFKHKPKQEALITEQTK